MSERQEIEELIEDLEELEEEYIKEQEEEGAKEQAENQAAWEELFKNWDWKRSLASFAPLPLIIVGLAGFATPPIGTPVAVICALLYIVLENWKKNNL